MKNILVPVDFSEHSVLALSYAIEIAKSLGENIVVLNTYEVRQRTGMMLNMDELLHRDAEEAMDKLMDKVRTQVGEMKITPVIKRGKAVDKITQAAKAYECDLIVMGSKGASGIKEVFIGSVAGGVVSNTEIPVLIIPENSKMVGFHKVVFAIGKDKVSEQDAAPLLNLVQKFDSELEVIHFGNEAEDPDEIAKNLNFTEALENYTVTYAYGQSDTDIEAQIQSFAKDNEADLICMIRRNRTFWQKIFNSSATLKQAYHSEIPLLILHQV